MGRNSPSLGSPVHCPVGMLRWNPPHTRARSGSAGRTPTPNPGPHWLPAPLTETILPSEGMKAGRLLSRSLVCSVLKLISS